MGKKMIFLVLSVLSVAILGLPTAASATPAHVNLTGKFTLKGGTSIRSSVSGTTTHCTEGGGSGEFLSTTGGTLQLTFSTCSITLFGMRDHCQSSNPVGATGVVTTTPLRFDLIMVAAGKPGILVTPHAAGGVFAHIECETIVGPIKFAFEGNGVIGTMKSPGCGASSSSATLDFNATSHGVQEHTLYTGITYRLTKNGENTAQDTEFAMTFTDGQLRTLTCT